MIVQIAKPGTLPARWRNFIQRTHVSHFEFYMENPDRNWWFVAVHKGQIAGIAGALRESKDDFFIGPCVVFEPFRGRGLQRALIRRREILGSELSATRAVSYTHYQNYASANNFVSLGYRLVPSWTRRIEDNGTFVFWGKRLCKPSGP